MSSPTTNQITNSSQVSGVTLTDVLNALRVTAGDGSGDMLRSVYDTDNDGKVDVANVAEAVPWTGVTGKPTLFPAQPYTHNHTISEVTDLQSALDEKQETLVSGDNIKSVNGSSLLGSGNITITSGVTDHGVLTGLTDDDHTQYHNDSRGDARYSLLAHSHTATSISNTPSGSISATTVQAAINELDSEKFDKSGGDIGGNINIIGTGRRITGDFSNATITDRTCIQTSTANGNTFLNLAPSGAAAASGLIVTSSSDLTNYSSAEMVVTPSAAIFRSAQSGTGTIVPLELNITATKCMRLDPTTFAFTSVNGPIGYGVGAGGTVTQATSKSTAVTLNKACGQITMNNAALAAGAKVRFNVVNSTVAAADMVIVAIRLPGSGQYKAWVSQIAAGNFDVEVQNNSAGSLSDAVVVSFSVLKGAIS